MLPRHYRLPAHIRLRHPRYYKTSEFLLKVSANNLPYSRFGFLVRKSIDKRATARNRIRRVFRSCIEEMLGEIQNGYDMFFLFEKGIIEKNREELYQELRTLLSQNNLHQ
jgi:ribonuclease P protein component